MKTAKIEIFRKGRYGDNESRIWGDREVAELIDNYAPDYRSAPIVLGHNSMFDGEKPAYGWVQKLSLDNGVVVADIEYSDELKEFVDKKMYKTVSIEATKKIELFDADGKDGAYLLAVAFLGGSVPAVSGLKPISFSAEQRQFSSAYAIDDIISYNSTSEEGENLNIEELAKNVGGGGSSSENFGKKENKNSEKVEMMEISELKEEVARLKEELKAGGEATEALTFKLEEANSKNEEHNKETFALKIKDTLTKYSKQIVPSALEKMEEFMLTLDEEQVDKFSSILSELPEIEIFKELTNSKNKEGNIGNDEKFAEQAKKDFESIKG